MNDFNAWKTFETSGKIDDYLTYRNYAGEIEESAEEKIRSGREREEREWESPLQ